MEKNGAFIIFDNPDIYEFLTDEERSDILMALVKKCTSGEVADRDFFSTPGSWILFRTISAQIDRSAESSKKKSESGKKGGSQPKNSKSKEIEVEEVEETETEEEVLKQEEECLSTSKSAEAPIPKRIPIPEPKRIPERIRDSYPGAEAPGIAGAEKSDPQPRTKPVRHKYGQYQNVLLSDEDMAKLQAECPTDWEERIERLSEYMASKGASYKDHLATIRAWKRKEGQSPPIRPQTGQVGQRPKNAFLAYNQREMDYDALERELAKMG